MGFTEKVARFISRTRDSEIPSPAYEHAKVAFADWLAVTLAGKDDPVVNILVRLADRMGGNEQASILGHDQKRDLLQATLVNGAASHALDFDDSLETFHGHPSVTLFPALLALSEFLGKSGIDFLASYIIGLQVGAAIGLCAGTEQYQNGWHCTSTIGHLASAAGCARLLQLEEKETRFALGIAGTQASGLKGVFGTMCKPLHAGKSSQAGLLSALLAADGFTSTEDILEGRFGFFDVLEGRVREEAYPLLENQRWVVEELAQKYHASCHFTHAPIESIWEIMRKHQLSMEKIESIEVRCSRLAFDVAAKTSPKTGLEGKFSIFYCVANAILSGDTGIAAFTEDRVNDPSTRQSMQKISVTPMDDFEPLKSEVLVKTVGGEVFSTSVDVFKEVPDLETKRNKIGAKFRSLCEPVIGKDKADELFSAILSMNKTKKIGEIVHWLNRAVLG